MCGIFGVISTKAITKDQAGFLESAFQAGQVRGIHGSGMFTSTKDGNVSCAKRALSGTDFLSSPEAKKLSHGMYGVTAAIGHNRFATHGGHTDDNCHPFKFGDVVGVHNGGIPLSVLDVIDPKDSHAVDSARLYKAISEIDNPIDVLTKIHSGAYSLVWHDARTNCMYLARNTQRPMSLVETPDALYIASEMGMMGWLLARHGLLPAGKTLKVGETNLYTLYTIPMDDPSKVTAEEYKAAPAPVPKSKPYQGVGYNLGNSIYNNSTVKDTVNKDLGNDRGRVCYTLESVEQKYPCLKSKVEFIRSIMFRENSELFHRINMIGYGVEETFRPSIHGAACSATGTTDEHLSVLASMRDVAANMHASIDFLPTEGDVEEDGSVGFPIMQMSVKSFLVRPSGDIVIQGTPTRDQAVSMYLFDVTDQEADWGTYVCSDDYMKQLDNVTLNVMWARMGQDDIPF